MPKLAIRRGDTLDREVELANKDLRIGRGEQNDIVLADPTKAVSRFHAELHAEGGRYVLADLGSQNGLWSGGKRHQKITLEPGVPVTIGPYTVTLSSIVSQTSETLIPPNPKTADTMRPKNVPPPPAPSPAPPPIVEHRDVAPPPPRPVPPPRPAPPPRPPIEGAGGIPKPILFGGIAVVLVVAIAIVVVVFLPASDETGVYKDNNQSASTTATTPTNEELKRQHLTQAQALVNAGDFEGALKELDQIPAAEAGSPEVTALRAKVEDLKAKVTPTGQQAPAVTQVANTPSKTPTPPASQPSGAGTQQPPPTQPPPVDTQAQAPGVKPPPPPPAGRGAPQNPRERENAERFDRARAAVDSGAFGNAIGLLNEIQSSDPNYPGLAALMTRARDGARAAAQKALEDGTRLENAGDLAGAVEQYGRAKQLDPSMGGVADESARRVRGRMRTEGTEAFTRARQYDALGRTADARTLYEKAFRFLPDDDPNKKIARERLDMLRAKP